MPTRYDDMKMEDRLVIRCTSEQKEEWRKAAVLRHGGKFVLSDWARNTLDRVSKKTTKEIAA